MKSNPKENTFVFNGLTITLHPDVYEPAEDTFQLLETITVQPEENTLELGTGCGIIALECARQGSPVICTDLNPRAVELTRHNIKQNQHLLRGTIEVRHGDLFSPINKDERFTLIIFNPPYLPTKPHERIDTWFDLATDGGKNGLAVTKRFITQLPRYLKKNGRAYVVFSSLANQTTLTKTIASAGLLSTVVSKQNYNDEIIDIYKITFPPKK